MKRLKFHRAIVAIAMMFIGWLPSLAHHFEINGVFYNVISTSEVEVTYKGSSYNEFYNEYNGSVVIPSLVEYGGFTYSVTSIGDNAFSSCDLTSIEIPNSVTSIGDYAFVYCSSLTSIQIPNSVTSIGDYVFYYCSSLTSIQIPNSVTSIGDYTFSNCSSLTSIKIPNSVTSIGESAFRGCESLTSIEIPNSVTSIGEGAFSSCNLTSVEIGNSVTSIGDYAFSNCSSLTSVIIGNSVTSIGYGAFVYCSSLASIVVDGGNTIYDSRNGCNAIIETTSNTLIAGCKNTIIPNSVTSIGDSAFNGCYSLTSIEIPNSVTSIGDDAFSWCDLTEIKCWATTPPTIYYNTFSSFSAELYVPAGCKESYEAAKYWNNFTNIIEVTLDAPVTLNDNNAIVATIGENIVVKNATVGSVVRVYTADGAMIASEFATEGDVIIEAPAKGIYVVKVGKQTVKVII